MESHINSGIRKILNYNIVYRSYQSLVKKNWADKYYVEKYIQPFDNDSILDLGCGDAHFLQYYPSSVDYEGYDMNPDYINSAKKKYGNKGKFYCSPVDSTVLTKNKFYNIVTANSLLHHISDEDATILFSMVSKILKPGGFLITSDPVYVPNQNPISKFMIKNDRGQSIRSKEMIVELAAPYFKRIETNYENNWFIFPFDLIINKYYL